MRMKMVTTSVQVVSPQGFSALQEYSPSSPGPRSSIARVTCGNGGGDDFYDDDNDDDDDAGDDVDDGDDDVDDGDDDNYDVPGLTVGGRM